MHSANRTRLAHKLNALGACAHNSDITNGNPAALFRILEAMELTPFNQAILKQNEWLTSFLMEIDNKHDEDIEEIDLDDDTPANKPNNKVRAHITRLNAIYTHHKKLCDVNGGTRFLTSAKRKELNAVLGMDTDSVEVLEFLVAIMLSRPLSQLIRQIDDISYRELITLISIATNISESNVTNSLSASGALRKSGIVSRDDGIAGSSEAFHWFDFLDGLMEWVETPNQSLTRAITPDNSQTATGNSLSVDDFDHLGHTVTQTHQILSKSLLNKKAGVNILLHGAPGTGKSSLARVWAQNLDRKLYVVPCVSNDDQPLKRSERIQHYRAIQFLLQSSDDKGIILFDEMEDVLPSYSLLQTDDARYKGHINDLLENNATPTVWVGNSISWVDDAFLRRFDVVLSVSHPPASKLRSHLENRLKKFGVPKKFIKQLASAEGFTLAEVDKIVSNLELSANDEFPIEQQIRDLLQARPYGHQYRKYLTTSNNIEIPYTLDALNTSLSASQVLSALKKGRRLRMLLHGAPGTGKTAFAKHLAEQLDTELMLLKASDLMSPFVGETEQKIARAFSEAGTRECLLFIDEADSFLQNREGASTSWEVSQVNEMLAQIDACDFNLILATNFANSMDRALMRRMDMKIEFNYLKSKSAVNMFWSAMDVLNDKTQKPNETISQQVRQINDLAPGDFAAAGRRLWALGVKVEAVDLIKALNEEVSVKQPYARPRIGF